MRPVPHPGKLARGVLAELLGLRISAPQEGGTGGSPGLVQGELGTRRGDALFQHPDQRAGELRVGPAVVGEGPLGAGGGGEEITPLDGRLLQLLTGSCLLPHAARQPAVAAVEQNDPASRLVSGGEDVPDVVVRDAADLRMLVVGTGQRQVQLLGAPAPAAQTMPREVEQERVRRLPRRPLDGREDVIAGGLRSQHRDMALIQPPHGRVPQQLGQPVAAPAHRAQ